MLECSLSLLFRGGDGVRNVLGSDMGNFEKARYDLKIQEDWIITVNFSGLW